MHIRAKYDGGKVINRSQSGAWEGRCMGAGLQQNEGHEWGPRLWKEMAGSSPSQVFRDTAERSAKKARKDKTRKSNETVKQQRRLRKYSRNSETIEARKAYSRHDGGSSPDDIDDDISSEHLEELKTSYYETKVVVTPAEATEIEQQTRDQADSEEWIVNRQKRITASMTGGVAKMLNTLSLLTVRLRLLTVPLTVRLRLLTVPLTVRLCLLTVPLRLLTVPLRLLTVPLRLLTCPSDCPSESPHCPSESPHCPSES